MKGFITCFGIIATLVLTGCGEKASTASDGDAENTIEFWHIQTYEPTKPAVEAAIARVEEKDPGLSVDATAIKNDPFKTKLATAMGARTEPDVFHTWGGGMLATYAEAGRVMPLDVEGIGTLDRFHPAALDFCRVDGTLYALPVDVGIVPMWYNAELFEQHGIMPPTTMDTFFAACDKLKAAGVTPLALGNQQSWPGAFYFIYFATRAGGAEALAKGDYDHDAFIYAGQQIKKLVDAGYFTEGFNGIGYDDARRQFFNGEAAMMLMGTWIRAHAKEEATPDFQTNLKSFSFPALGRNEVWDATVVGGVNAAYAVAASTEHPEDCLALLRGLTSDQAMTDWAATGRIPALSKAAAQDVLGHDLGVAHVLYEASSIQLYYDQLLPPALGAMHKETTQAIFAGAMTPEEAAAQMVKTAERLK